MTSLNLDNAKRLLKEFSFTTLFTQELGWDKLRLQPRRLTIDDETFTLTPVAEKRGFQVFSCASIGEMPLRAVRVKIDRELTKLAYEHLIVFEDAGRSAQVWRWEQRDEGQPRVGREERFIPAEGSGERLAKKLERLIISLDEEEQTTLQSVTTRARAAFNVERVTKKFYDRFKKEHEAFLKLIEGIDDAEQKSWYASLMLNRLMFVYFIQHKRFLDGDNDYLQNRLARIQAEHGADKFYSFYRFFLLRLFHDGLGQRGRTRELEKLLGKVPYLNGGLFDVHQLEAGAKGRAIEIPDKAFARVFKFFDEYDWLLDDRPLRDEREINPDVLGYIFEKYINQKQMGAYYTKEDITEYISKNTIIPFLLERAQKLCANAFDEREGVWRLLRDRPDRYIYAAMRKGVIDEHGAIISLPPEIAAGVDDVKKRGRWNTTAGALHALPTETWREHVARRERCLDLRALLLRGEVKSIRDLLTLNLDIRQFTQDMLATYEGSDLIAAFYRAIAGRMAEKSDGDFEQGLSVLDPTCGSGAFLFSALNVLEPLVAACIERMRSFVEEADRAHRTQAHPSFRRVLAEIGKHPSAEYFVLKSIIIGNLYGVDLMEEATEICKLRLFLKLVAQVERDDRRENMGLEPLPDIDFNIRAGNTLVGFANLDEVKAAASSKLDFSAGETVRRIEEDAHEADRADKRFRRMQTVEDYKDATPSEFKQELRQRLDTLAASLDCYLAEAYGKDPHKPKEFEAWRKSHQPFHWFTEFYGIISGGGFDVIIGNPPYVEYRLVRGAYKLQPGHYKSEPANNLYAFCMERSAHLLGDAGWFGMIVPAGVLGLDDAAALREALLRKYAESLGSTYAIRPSKLFDGVDQRLCIYIGRADAEHRPGHDILTTRYHHWNADEREALFSQLEYVQSFMHPQLRRIPQLGSSEAASILRKLKSKDNLTIASYYAKSGGHVMHYHRSPRYWIRAMDFEQYFKSSTRTRSVHHFRDLYFRDEDEGKSAGAILNSSLFFFWFVSVGNGRNITGTDVEQFPVGTLSREILKELPKRFDRLMKDYQANSFIRVRQDCEFQEFRVSMSKFLIDEIDRALAAHYGFTDEELDFIINYDIKYRMGSAEAEGDGDE
jgi:hypothetical protein